MVTIRKVTGATTAELNKIENQAYETASAYGVAADEYLNSVANFSRAGYGEQASALAELATRRRSWATRTQRPHSSFCSLWTRRTSIRAASSS